MSKNLEQRLQAQTGAPVAPPNLADQIRKMEPAFERALPKGYEASQLVRDALTAVRATPKLAQCDHMSALGAFMTCAQLGLRPNVLGQAYVVPYWDRMSSGYRAQLQIGYQGYIELAYRSPRVSTVSIQTVFEADQFHVVYGSEPQLVHQPSLDGDRGKAVAYYAVVRTTDGNAVFWHMSRFEAERYRDEHASARTKDGRIVGPWRDHFDAMAMKSCIRQLAKVLPKSTADASLGTAMAVDESVREDAHPDALHQVRFPEVTPSPETQEDAPQEG